MVSSVIRTNYDVREKFPVQILGLDPIGNDMLLNYVSDPYLTTDFTVNVDGFGLFIAGSKTGAIVSTRQTDNSQF